MIRGKKIVIGITGGIAAYKIPFLIRLLIREGAEVKVIMTPTATKFITPLTLSTLSRNEVIISPFREETGSWNNHVDLGRWADVMLFAPVTANSLGKMANGIADNFLVTVYLSAKCNVFLAPAMDLDMFRHPSTQKNLEILASRGNRIIEPQTGELASGLSGPGRMEEPEKLFAILESFFSKGSELAGKKILVTAGPTHERIDPVRFIANDSTGMMGFSIAEEAAGRGGEVILVTGPTHLSTHAPSISCIKVESAQEMFDACRNCIEGSDILIMAAAVADFQASQPSGSKIKKGDTPPVLVMTNTPDILQELGKYKREDQVFIGFALETDHALENARSKLHKKNLDIIVLNSLDDPGAGFGERTNKVTLILKNGQVIPGDLKPKREIASDILNVITQYLLTKGKSL